MKNRFFLILFFFLILAVPSRMLQAAPYDPSTQIYAYPPPQINPCIYDPDCPEPPTPTPDPTDTPTPDPTDTPDPSEDPILDLDDENPDPGNIPDGSFDDVADPIDVFLATEGCQLFQGTPLTSGPNLGLIWFGLLMALGFLRLSRKFKG